VKELAGNIFEFLSSHNYENVISKKGLSNGNKAIFVSMMSFLLKLLDPMFNVDLNMATEDDIIRLLKMMGYSYSLPKNFFAAMGAPNNWTLCLHIINWIIEIIHYYEEVYNFIIHRCLCSQTNTKDKDPKNPGEKSDNEVLNEYVQKKFLMGPDSLEIEGPNELTER